MYKRCDPLYTALMGIDTFTKSVSVIWVILTVSNDYRYAIVLEKAKQFRRLGDDDVRFAISVAMLKINIVIYRLQCGQYCLQQRQSMGSSSTDITSQEVFQREHKFGAHNYHPLPVALCKAEGQSTFLHQPNNCWVAWVGQKTYIVIALS